MKDEKDQNIVAFIENPYGLANLEVSEAQRESEPLELDEEVDAIDMSALSRELESSEPEMSELPDLDEDQLARISDAIGEAETEQAEIQEVLSADEAQDAAAELAAQIAEDEAIAAQLAQDAAEQEGSDQELLAALPKAPEVMPNGELDLQEMESCLEALLFMSDKPVSVEKLRDLLGPELPLPVFQEAISSLIDRYKANHHGFELVAVAGGFQFRTKPGRAALAKKLAKIQMQRLSSGAMETLAIIAYKQPAMKEDIDKIRGVDTSYFIRGLLDKKLVQITGRSELPGRPMLYSTTQEFLEVFGLKEL
ncbi:MAG TPA: SMC-Scp complex subunit ScpB, partial [Bdellovibrionales bacterium]|nr:SMC-Scp complex subunit ScpB [Bdellovibrionales bacterium]